MRNTLGENRLAPLGVILAFLVLPHCAQGQIETGLVGWGTGANISAGASNVVALSAKSSWLALTREGNIFGIPGSTNITAVGAGYSHSLAVSNGAVLAWGDNSAGQINVPAGLSNVLVVVAGVEYSLALRSDGTIAGWGYNGYGQISVPPQATNVIAISAGYYHTLALKGDGTVSAWGYNGDGEINVPANLSGVVAVAGGYYHSLALRSDGTVVAWGSNASGQSLVPSGLNNVVAIAAGADHSMALLNDGTIKIWGDNSYGQTNVPPGLANVVGIAGGYGFSLAITNDGTPWILKQPLDRLAYEGSPASFSVTVLAQQPATYQWQVNNVNIQGATNTSLVLPNVTSNDAGAYHLVISNALRTVVSSNAILAVLPPPAVTIQPQNVVTNGGANFVLTPSVANPGPFSYQWRFNGTNLAGYTNAALNLTNALDSQSGNYDLVIADQAGTSTSTVASVTIIPWVTPHVSPNPALVGSGTFEAFTLSAAGFSGPTVYQWRLNGQSMGGFWAWTNSSSVTYSGPSMSIAGDYDIVASDSLTTVTSTVTTLTVVPLTITVQPTNRATWVHGAASFAVTTIGATPIGYQWRFNQTNIPGATSNPLVLSNIGPDQLGAYDVVATNAYTNLTSSTATLSLSQVAAWGNGTENSLIPGLTNLAAVSAGGSGGIALRQDGSVVTWPTALPFGHNLGATNLVAIAGGTGRNYGLRADGTGTMFPSDGTGVVPGMSGVVAISRFGSATATLNSTGLAAADVYSAPLPSGLTNMVAVAQGGSHGLGLKYGGTIVPWGSNGYGQTNVPPGLSNVVAVAAGYNHSLALRSDGLVFAWGDNSQGQTKLPAGLSNVVAIAAGFYHSLALKNDGTVVAWGVNNAGVTNVPVGLSNVVAISAGNGQSLALIGDGPPVIRGPVSLTSAGNNGAALRVPSQSGQVYGLEYKNNLADPVWSRLPLVAGTGTNVLLMDPAPTNAQRFYRVMRW